MGIYMDRYSQVLNMHRSLNSLSLNLMLCAATDNHPDTTFVIDTRQARKVSGHTFVY